MKVEEKYGLIIGVAIGVTAIALYFIFKPKLKGNVTESGKGFLALVPNVITSLYGNRIFNGATQFHNGIDIGFPVGTPVKAPADSTVAVAGYDSLNGNHVFLDHANGYRSGYLHLSEMDVKVGDKVKRGVVFAKTGNTGEVVGNGHLHLMLWKDGKVIDPSILLAA